MSDLLTDHHRPGIGFNISSHTANVVWARAALRGLCSEIRVGRISTFHLELCLTEAVNNVIKHAYKDQPGADIQIHWYADAATDTITLDVIDRGKPLDLDRLERADISMLQVDEDDPETLRESGRGLAFIKALMDDVRYRSEAGINQLRMRLKFSRS